MRKLKWFYLILPLMIVFLGVNLFFRLVFLAERYRSIYSPIFPEMNITLNGITLDEIKENSKEIKYEGNSLELTVKGIKQSFDNVEIKGRGNSTWGGDKRPFQIKFDSKVDLFGLGPRKKYILLANSIDYSSIRNAMMFRLADMIDERFHPTGEFVELNIDGGYQGLYYLTTKIEVGKGSVDLRDKYGILVELDTLHKSVEDCLPGVTSECLIAKDAVFDDDDEIIADAAEDFLKDFTRLQAAAKKGDYRTVSELIDVNSFAEYFLISEFAVNPDAFVSSFNFYKDGMDDKIHAGPLWDYDYAFGNRKWVWSSNDDFYSPTETMAQRADVFKSKSSKSDSRKLMYYLIDIPEFRAEVERIFREKMSGNKFEFVFWTFREAAKIKAAATRDMDRWGMDESLFYKEIKYLLDWVIKRYDYFEEEYGEKQWIYTPGVI